MYMRSFSALVGLVLIATPASMFAKKKDMTPIPVHVTSPSPAVTDDFIHKQFGDDCSLLQGPQQFAADLDADGVEDLMVVARCGNPLADQDQYAFKVIDPYDKFLGFGDVKVTSTFASDEPERRGLCLLIVHGVGSNAWRAETPKAKFVIINLPFKTLAVKRFTYKHRQILGLFVEERGEGESTSSVIFWDGKRYKYQQIGATLE